MFFAYSRSTTFCGNLFSLPLLLFPPFVVICRRQMASHDDPTQPTTDFSFQELPSSRLVGWGPAGNRPHEKQLIPTRAWEKKEDERPLFPLQQKEVGRKKSGGGGGGDKGNEVDQKNLGRVKGGRTRKRRPLNPSWKLKIDIGSRNIC